MRREGEVERLVLSLMNLPASPVWINERHIYTAISLPQGQTFGRYHSLSCLVNIIKKGYCGNKKKKDDPYFVVDQKYAHCSFNEQNPHNIAIQEYGSKESFDAGGISESVIRTPRWFCFGGRAICNLKTQLSIMAEAVGDDSISMDDSTRTRRKAGFVPFFFGANVDGGYSMVDVPRIAYENHHYFPSLFDKSQSSFVDANTGGLQHLSRDVFDSEELSKFEDILRHIIVGKVDGSKVLVSGDKWVLQKTHRANNTRVTTVRSLTPPPRPLTQDHQYEPPPRKPRRERHNAIDNDDGYVGLPLFLQKSKLGEYMFQLTIFIIIYSHMCIVIT
jgi:hypothetical protein